MRRGEFCFQNIFVQCFRFFKKLSGSATIAQDMVCDETSAAIGQDMVHGETSATVGQDMVCDEASTLTTEGQDMVCDKTSTYTAEGHDMVHDEVSITDTFRLTLEYTLLGYKRVPKIGDVIFDFPIC